MKPKLKLLAFILFLYSVIAVFGSIKVSAGEVLIIGNKNIPETSLEPDTVKNIFLGDKTIWENNEKITLVVVEYEPVHVEFLKKYINRTANQFRNTWRHNLFTGKGRHPVGLKTMDQVVDYVAKHQWAIGYVSSDKTLPADVKVMSR